MGELIYTFTSLAARHTKDETCIEGMRLLARTLHPHGVKITWIVSPESARLAAPQLTEWHETYGDDAAVGVMDDPPAPGDAGDVLAQARDAIAKVLPWANLTVAGSAHTVPGIAGILEDLGFEGLWGFCWEQIEVDQITDRGSPWGMYYMDRDERLRPAQGPGALAMEWTARDLLKSYHSGNPTLYSTDPNDVARGGICSWDDIAYWKGMAGNYIRNLRHNRHVFLQQHQESHEMERSEVAACFTDEDIEESAVMLDAFVRHVKERAGDALRMMTLPEAARLYRETYAETPPSYMLWDDTPTREPNRDYAWSLCAGPWPRTFLYCDKGAQMIFVEGQVEPVCIRNYTRSWESGQYFAEPGIPYARLVRNTQFKWNRELEIAVEAPRAMPYGLALWGDYTLYQLGEAPGLLEGRILNPDLLFLRYDLKKGTNTLKVELQGK